MKTFFFITILCICSRLIYSQTGIDNICRIENDRLVFVLDKKWSDEQKKVVSIRYSLDSALIEQAFSGKEKIFSDSIEWLVIIKNSRTVEISKMLNDNSIPFNKYSVDAIISTLGLNNVTRTNNTTSFGINNFNKKSRFKYEDSIALFFLRGHLNAKKVYLSGSFNQWSTRQLLMNSCDSGWILRLKLPPDKYLYKYIVDGEWITDPDNKILEPNEHGTFNSVVFCTNYTFKLKNYEKSKKVVVTGNFTNWNKKGIPMQQTTVGWELSAYFADGTYLYKFIVDKNWIVDPDNPNTKESGFGSINSVIEFGEKYVFKINGFTKAQKVILSGNFNEWNTNDLTMEKTDSGWTASFVLPAGNYEYKLIVDGKWTIDTTNSRTTGYGEFINSVLVVKPNHLFVLSKHLDANSVAVSGTFNNWLYNGYPLEKKDGKWIIPVHLSQGKHLYKYIVDGNWIIDPDNELWEENEYGTGNSVLWIK